MSRVLLTRAPEDNAPLAAALRARGARVLEPPCVRVEHVDQAPLAAALRALGPADRLVFTSRAGVDAARRALRGEQPRAMVAVGAVTAARCAEWGIEAWRPSEATGEHLGRELPLGEGGVFLARAEHADEALPRELARRGARVREIIGYRVVAEAHGDVAAAAQALAAGAWVVLASPSAAGALARAVGRDALAGARALALGPTTARRWRELTAREARVITRLNADNVLREELSNVADR